MKFKLIIFLAPFLLACSVNTEHPENEPNLQQTDRQMPEDEPGSEPLDWQAYQDSLRTALLNSKPDNFLKGSALEELYIRNLVLISGDELAFNLPLDLHSFDCGAPDCYSTDIKFKFPHHNQLEFPDQLTFSIHEHGCVDAETQTTGTMKLVENGSNYINYYSTDQQSNLVIHGEDKRMEYVYYFTEVEPDSIKANQIPELIMSLSDTSAAPYRSTRLQRSDYERFLSGNF